jgi:hypothetical protein
MVSACVDLVDMTDTLPYDAGSSTSSLSSEESLRTRRFSTSLLSNRDIVNVVIVENDGITNSVCVRVYTVDGWEKR